MVLFVAVAVTLVLATSKALAQVPIEVDKGVGQGLCLVYDTYGDMYIRDCTNGIEQKFKLEYGRLIAVGGNRANQCLIVDDNYIPRMRPRMRDCIDDWPWFKYWSFSEKKIVTYGGTKCLRYDPTWTNYGRLSVEDCDNDEYDSIWKVDDSFLPMPSNVPSDLPSDVPSSVPSSIPSDVPSDKPSSTPSSMPSNSPSDSPSDLPSSVPSNVPSDVPSLVPSSIPSNFPSDKPSSTPSSVPSNVPSDSPSDLPSLVPSHVPSDVPSLVPSSIPSDFPSDNPSSTPSSTPSSVPSNVPSDSPSDWPSSVPSDEPSEVPSSVPSSLPSALPSTFPSDTPSSVPSSVPSTIPSNLPSSSPSTVPSSVPTSFPSDVPSTIPTSVPSFNPSVCTFNPLLNEAMISRNFDNSKKKKWRVTIDFHFTSCVNGDDLNNVKVKTQFKYMLGSNEKTKNVKCKTERNGKCVVNLAFKSKKVMSTNFRLVSAKFGKEYIEITEDYADLLSGLNISMPE